MNVRAVKTDALGFDSRGFSTDRPRQYHWGCFLTVLVSCNEENFPIRAFRTREYKLNDRNALSAWVLLEGTRTRALATQLF